MKISCLGAQDTNTGNPGRRTPPVNKTRPEKYPEKITIINSTGCVTICKRTNPVTSFLFIEAPWPWPLQLLIYLWSNGYILQKKEKANLCNNSLPQLSKGKILWDFFLQSKHNFWSKKVPAKDSFFTSTAG